MSGIKRCIRARVCKNGKGHMGRGGCRRRRRRGEEVTAGCIQAPHSGRAKPTGMDYLSDSNGEVSTSFRSFRNTVIKFRIEMFRTPRREEGPKKKKTTCR